MWREHWTNSIIFEESKTPSNRRLLALSLSWLDLGPERGVHVLGSWGSEPVNPVQTQASELRACGQVPEPQMVGGVGPPPSGCEDALSLGSQVILHTEHTLRRVSGEGAGRLRKKARPSAPLTGNQQAHLIQTNHKSSKSDYLKLKVSA